MKLREEMPELEGAKAWFNGEVSKSDLVGNKPLTLVHFWSISCGLCKEAMPMINEFRDEYSEDMNVIAVHMPRSEKDLDLDEIKEVADQHDISQPIFVDSDHKLTDAFDNQYVPAYYVFDSEGKLRHFQAGGEGRKMLTKRITKLLDKAKKED